MNDTGFFHFSPPFNFIIGELEVINLQAAMRLQSDIKKEGQRRVDRFINTDKIKVWSSSTVELCCNAI